MNKKLSKVLNIILDVLIVLFMLFSVMVLVVALTTKDGEPTQIFGYSINSVQSTSMELYKDGKLATDEGAFKKGDLIICKKPDDHIFEVGDIVTFKMPGIIDGSGNFVEYDRNDAWDTQIIVTHKIVEVVEENGARLYRTQGISEHNIAADINLKTSGHFIAEYTGKRIGGIGKIFDFLKTPNGILICLVLPILVFVIIQTIRVIRNFAAYKAQKTFADIASGELTEEQKRLIAEEYMKTLNTSNSPEAAPEKKPEEAEETSSEETSSESEAETQE